LRDLPRLEEFILGILSFPKMPYQNLSIQQIVFVRPTSELD
jgi:hypothetical protein